MMFNFNEIHAYLLLVPIFLGFWIYQIYLFDKQVNELFKK